MRVEKKLAVIDTVRSPSELSPFTGYSYSYPHKTAYRALAPRPLREVWQHEPTEGLFVYVHLPFCEFRCGFCNLFTFTQPPASLVADYLVALRRQILSVRSSLPDARFARLAIGGGTPTFLSVAEFERLFRMLRDDLGIDARIVPASCEASPATVSSEKLALLRENGVDRLSLGVQSFRDHDVHSMGRPQRSQEVVNAINLVRQHNFPTLNLDLIYGSQQQSLDSWLESVEQAVAFDPQELYLYPLYVRELTGLGKLEARQSLDHAATRDTNWDNWRLAAYRVARDYLFEHGFNQTSLRMFERSGDLGKQEGPVYCCQEDGMVGLGCGARSYTKQLHYSTHYAVSSQAVLSIIKDYVAKTEHDFESVSYGIELNDFEQRRRYLITSLLQVEGLSRSRYANRFGNDVLADFAELPTLVDEGLAKLGSERLKLTASGIERSDAIGPWLYSSEVRQRMDEYQCL